MSGFPGHWVEVEIGDVANVVGGGTPRAKDLANFTDSGSGVAWLTPADLSGYREKIIAHGKRDLTEQGLLGSSAVLLPRGTVLFSSRAPIGYVAIAGNEIATNQGFKSFVFPSGIDSSFAYFFLKSIRALAESRGTGTTFKELSGAAAKKLPFVIAPENEQQKISAKLDSLFAKLEESKIRLEKVPGLLKRFRQSVLLAASNGHLTEGWRSVRNVTKWKACKLIDVIQAAPRNGYSPKGVSHETPIRNLTLSAVTKGYFAEDNFKFVDIDVPADSHLWLKSGDILIQRANSFEHVGVSALYSGEDDRYIYPDLMMKCRANETALPEFLHYSLLSEPVREYFRVNATGTSGNMPKINQKVVSSAPLNIPGIDEQREIVRRVESLFALADRVEQQYLAAKKRVDRLSQSILAKAFRGELVPQDPNDEPAEQLFARIRAERESQQATKPKRKKRTAGRQLKHTKRTAMKLSEAPEHYLKEILAELGGEAAAEVLWQKSAMDIDDFYAKLKREMDGHTIVDNASPDPAQRRLTLVA